MAISPHSVRPACNSHVASCTYLLQVQDANSQLLHADVSVSGWLQGGGLGPMDREYGLGIDNVVAFDVTESARARRRFLNDTRSSLQF